MDAGLAAWLLSIRKTADIVFHAQRGNLFETLIVTEFLKRCWNDGMPSNLFFRRDSRGLEIDLIVEQGEVLTPIEIKSGKTIAADFMDNLKKWSLLAGKPEQSSWLIYGGEQRIISGATHITPWKQLDGM